MTATAAELPQESPDVADAVLRGDPTVEALIPGASRTGITTALRYATECASMTGRRCHVGSPTADEVVARTRRLREMVAALLAADADVPAVSASDDDLVDGIARYAKQVAAVVPVAGVIAWVWCHQLAGECRHYPAIATYAAGLPLGLDDAVTAGWAARRAAEHADEPWSLRLLAALGAAS